MLTTGEVAKLFQVSAQTVINWLDQGRMPYERIGRGPRRLTEETVLNYIKEIGISPTALDQTIYEKLIRRLYSANGEAKSSAVAIISPELSLIGWNEEAHSLTGLSSMEVLGKPLSEIITRVNGSMEPVDQIFKGNWENSSLEIGVSHRSNDGQPMQMDLTVSKFYAQGKLAGYTIVYRPKENA